MAKYYKLPLLSRLADWVASMLPNRVRALIWIDAYRDLDRHYRDVDDHHADGSRSLYRGISEVQVENLMRGIWRVHLHATVHERERSKDHG